MATRLYGIVWRWHFFAGLAACPIVFVIALTGALYVFEDEIERWRKPALVEVEPGDDRAPIDRVIAAVAPACAPAAIAVPAARERAAQVWCGGDGEGRRWFVDPYRLTVLGDQDDRRALFPVVERLHTSLLLGERGRLVVEWATSWAVLLMASGAYLWWPSGRRGTWWPRHGVAARQQLRDLHAIAGAYAVPVLFAIAATGLCWTQLAGERRWAAVVDDPIARTWRAPPRSTVIAGAPRVGIDAALRAARLDADLAPRDVYVALPATDDAAYAISAYSHGFGAPWAASSTWVDAYSGQVLRQLVWRDLSSAAAASNALYAVHAGAIGGLAGRIAVLLAALVLAGLCVTGPWMWWKRRPRGGLGVPPPARHVPAPMIALLAGLGALLPAVGWTLVAVIAVEGIAWAVRCARARLGERSR